MPERWRAEYGLRRYGFHGLSYSWALQRAAQALGRPVDNLQVVLVHLGGGCSACAVRNGRSVDTTMGLTPLEGLVMSRRSGSLDPGALLWLQRRHGLSTDELDDTLHRHSGLLGLSGTSGDTRDLVRAARRVMPRPRWRWRRSPLSCRRGIASMAASLDRLDALAFTGEIGEDQPEVREEICSALTVLGVRGGLLVPELDDLMREGLRRIGRAGRGVPVFVVATGETQQIAAETRRVLGM
ncbi:Acetate kinase [Streptomyces graminofaciens]|uniref:Acetate kinase n=1 Tax=Streptomyces graminofaciens TaxID=68212 RepID=A0ABN5V6E8_9ACTN|nr:Acetate kinase [Streptomyces graminofaciens]